MLWAPQTPHLIAFTALPYRLRIGMNEMSKNFLYSINKTYLFALFVNGVMWLYTSNKTVAFIESVIK
jgi:hypothetical protein